MPGDTNGSSLNSARLKNMMWKRQRAGTDGDMGRNRFPSQDVILPDQIRQKLNLLFGQIEQEFEKMYTENISLKEKVALLTGQLEQFGDKTDGLTEKNTELIIADAIESTNSGHQKPAKKSGSQISQKIKSTYKTSTSRIANTFKNSTSTGCGQFVKEFPGHSDGVWEVSVSKCGVRVVGTASADYTAKVWCIESGAALLQYYGHRGSVNSIRFNPLNDLVVTSSGDQTAHVWKSLLPNNSPHNSDGVRSSSEEDNDDDHRLERNGEISNTHFIHAPLLQLNGHSNVVVAADWLHTGDRVVTGSWDGSAIVHDAERGASIETLCGHENELTNVVCHPNQALILTSSKDSSVRLWDLRESSVRVNAFMGHSASVSSAVFACGEKIISGSDDRSVKLWDMKNMSAPYQTIRSDSAVNRLSVSQQGVIAVPHDNKNIRLYDLNGNRMGRLPRNSRLGHNRMVCSTAWNDESNGLCNLLSSGFEKQVLGWQVNLSKGDGKELKRQYTA